MEMIRGSNRMPSKEFRDRVLDEFAAVAGHHCKPHIWLLRESGVEVGKVSVRWADEESTPIRNFLVPQSTQVRVDSGKGQNRTLRLLSALWPPVFAGEQDVAPPKG